MTLVSFKRRRGRGVRRAHTPIHGVHYYIQQEMPDVHLYRLPYRGSHNANITEVGTYAR